MLHSKRVESVVGLYVDMWIMKESVCVHSASLGQVYEQHQDEDGFLYVAYSSETTFGWLAANDLVHAYICWIWTLAIMSDSDTDGNIQLFCIIQGVWCAEYASFCLPFVYCGVFGLTNIVSWIQVFVIRDVH